MTSRRFLTLLPLAIAVFGTPMVSSAAADDATAFISNMTSELTGIVNSNGPISEKQRRISAIIDTSVDVPEIARFCLGRFWRTASPAQQKTYISLFHDVLVNDVTGKLGEYQGVKVTITGARKRDDSTFVSSIVERPNNPPSRVDWVVREGSSGPKLVDLVAEGTSLRLTQRNDYAAYVTHNNNSIDALLDAMKQHLTQSGG
jgi:phospholipid transport system substrate-binding protein